MTPSPSVVASRWLGKCCGGIRTIAPPMNACRGFPRGTWPPLPASPRAGGCTFPENPALSCAFVLPIWSAAVNPRVLTVRAVQPSDLKTRLFDGRSPDIRRVCGPAVEHLLVDRGGEPIRLDVIEGTTAAGPVALRFDLTDDEHLETQIAAIRSVGAPVTTGHRHRQLARTLLALEAVDARDAGASLREAADLLLGPGDWPGDGEHRKSLIRRMIVAGAQVVRTGPRAVLMERPQRTRNRRS
ncbi:DUF2285 domain-containing protein [Sphingomonas koreensis]|nr:DUF2285 domain-containing protein [Sphingomonas koreensis]